MSARPMPAATETAAEEPLGRLSPVESRSAHKSNQAEALRHARAVEQATDDLYAARGYRESFERRIRDRLSAEDFELILQFCDWQARELYLRDRVERMKRNG